MSEQNKKESIFKKLVKAGEAQLDAIIAKSKALPVKSSEEEDQDLIYQKSILKDVSLNLGSQGYQEKSARLSFQFQKQMALRDTIVASVIQTRQNQVAAHSKYVKSPHERGFMIVLKNEEKALQKIREELFGKDEDITESPELAGSGDDQLDDNLDEAADETMGMKDGNRGEASPEGAPEEQTEDSPEEEKDEDQKPTMKKAGNPFAAQKDDEPGDEEEPEDGEPEEGGFPFGQDEDSEEQPQPGAEQEKPELNDFEKDRIAKKELQKRNKDKIEAIANLVSYCGQTENRPFETKRWNFDSYLRAITADRLKYDQFTTEFVYAEDDATLHHWLPNDASTIRFATPQLKFYRNFEVAANGYDILYPEQEIEYLEEKTDALKLDEAKLAKNEYKFVQLINGRIVRAFTEEELALGMGNPTTDIYANGYSLSELELLMRIITAHLNTEYYNIAYFTQGFSAKGMLHIKAALPRRKLESVRVMWDAMMKGSKNSFQTPIFAGAEDINWIPLTQNHQEMEFNLWMQYLIRVICAIYQIDPFEIGFGMQEMGGSGGNLGGDNSETKIDNSKDKGLKPLLRCLEDYINKNIVDKINPDFQLVFTGVNAESTKETLERQEKEVKFKKTVAEIREESGLPLIPGTETLILDSIYMQWWMQFSPEAKKAAAQVQQPGEDNPFPDPYAEQEGEEDEQPPFGDEQGDEEVVDDEEEQAPEVQNDEA